MNSHTALMVEYDHVKIIVLCVSKKHKKSLRTRINVGLI
ncbi:hypothetical protein BT93_K2077 [Corymbia citriodora subsp. variegata]|nr:hypothetical protein BT93_K2077 [Corymbia citriodora subsp. variegata]